MTLAPYPAALEDCYAVLQWTAEHVDALGVDLDRLAQYGESAGGGRTVNTALLAGTAMVQSWCT